MNIRSGGVAALLGTLAALVPAAPAAAATAPNAAAAQLSVRRCAPRSPVRCGRVVVPLDRGGAVPGRVGLHVRTLDPPRGRRAAGTVVALAGGPGQAAAPLLEQIAAGLGRLRTTHRIVAFDQRGTGRSGRLRCRALERVSRPSRLDAAVAACARALGARAGAYTSSASVDDIEAVRRALGEERIALYAVSYGTKVALDYAARHPDRVSRLVLDSVVPQSGNDPFWRATFAAVPRVLSTLCGRRGCPFTRDATADLATLVRRAADRPLQGRWFDGAGRPRSARIAGEDLFGLLLAGDFDAQQRSELPAALHSGAQGDLAPLIRLARSTGAEGVDPDSGDSDALYVATTCTDGQVPWPAGTPTAERRAAFSAALAAVPAEQLAPFDRATVRGLRADSCRGWPQAPIVQPVAPLPAVPALILSGGADLRTPRSDAAALARTLPRARLLAVPGIGHSVLSSAEMWNQPCAVRAVGAFFAGRRVADCRATRLPPVARQLPRRLADVPSRRGLPPRVGRSANAFLLTYGDAMVQLMIALFTSEDFGEGEAGRFSFGIGGLRGGAVRVSERAIVLDRYSYVPGVTVSLRLSLEGEATRFVARVGGPAAARGRLVVNDGGEVRGRLGGRRVHLTEKQSTAVIEAGMSSTDPRAAELPTAATLAAQLERLRAKLRAR